VPGRAGDFVKLRRLKRQGVRVATAEPLIEAAFGGFLGLVRCLCEEFGVNVNHQMSDDGWTPLLSAAYEGHVGVARCLVNDLGANVNQASQDGTTPLCIAA
jgi:ankyrin repeat protein